MQENRLMDTVLVSEWNGNSPIIQGFIFIVFTEDSPDDS